MAGSLTETDGFVNNVGCEENGSAGTTETLRPKVQWCENRCVQVAAVRPLPTSTSLETSPTRAESSDSAASPAEMSSAFLPIPLRLSHTSRRNCTEMCPFSFDVRDSMQRVSHAQRLERLQKECYPTFTFRANPVRKYKPLVLKQSSCPLTVPRSPFSRSGPLK